LEPALDVVAGYFDLDVMIKIELALYNAPGVFRINTSRRYLRDGQEAIAATLGRILLRISLKKIPVLGAGKPPFGIPLYEFIFI
jgi:hypothetical protein